MYGLIGEKLTHSFSADFFNNKFKREGIAATYNLFPLPSITDLPFLLQQCPELKGLNVTIPYKMEVLKFLDSLSKEASEIGAVNVIKIDSIGSKPTLIGFNTDYIGFRDSLKPLLRNEIKKALILGTGGASKAVAYALNELCIDYKFVSRNPIGSHSISYADINAKSMKEYLLFINTTPLGMFPDIEDYPPLPYHLFNNSHICYDLIYNPGETLFMKKAREMGATVKNGLEMLRLQALAAWDIWTK